MAENISIIHTFASRDAFLISKHARSRMFERRISTDDIVSVLQNGEIIEEYDDEPCPSV